MDNYFKSVFEYKLIYIFCIEDKAHKGLLKIGDTTIKTESSIDSLSPNCRELNQAAKNRINQYTKTAAVSYKLLHTEIAIRTERAKDGKHILKAFRDHDVHRVLKNSNITNVTVGKLKGKEWFEIDIETAMKAIEAVKRCSAYIEHSETSQGSSPIVFRPAQENAINKTLNQFKTGNKMLWNAKMRFGKTLCALEVVKKSNFNRTIIITHRPVVDDSWYEDFGNIFYNSKEYRYGSKNFGESIDKLIEEGSKFVYFASMQDLRESERVGGQYKKNDLVFDIEWDFVVIDEAHEGTTTNLGEKVIKEVTKENTKVLALSGTPFNILHEYDDNIYTWDYVMEQQSKKEWDEKYFGDSNPYDELPELRIYTYDLGKILSDKRYIELEDKAFNFKEFFRIWTGDINLDRITMPNNCNIGDFYHEKDVLSFLYLISADNSDSNYPFSKEEYRALFKHSLWMLPGVKEAKALSKLLKGHNVFGNGLFDIVNVAGEGDEEEKNEDALKKVRQAIDNAGEEGYTITLSCGKLTTGVTVPEWTAVFMLSGSFSTSAANYLQTIFRVQSPCNKNGMIKQCCYVFDFAPDRTLKMVAEAAALSTKAGKATETDKKIMGEFLNFCPVISVDGTKMKEYDTNKLLQQLKRAYAERAVKNGFDDNNLYNDELLKLDGVALEDFKKLKGIVGSSKSAHKIKEINLNNNGFTEEDHGELDRLSKKKKNELTPEEEEKLKKLNEKKKQKGDAISILRAISIRMPLLIYGANIDINEDFTLDKFLDNKIVDLASWEEFMPKGVTKSVFRKFIKYYDEEIFIAAGRNIRNKVMAADELNPTERIKAITQLMAGFKNPDKETVLTPWKVVNMHMSESLGGYNFFDIDNNMTIDEPRFVNQGEVTFNTLGNPNAQILEINSKTGLYPLYVAYSIFKAKCDIYKKEELTYGLREKLWVETIMNNIYVICKTPMAKQITKRTLVGYRDIKINSHYFEDIINMLKNKPKQFKERVLKSSYWKREGVKEMKFDAVVGNPPYQDSTSVNNRSGAIYPYFYDAAGELSNRYSLITPARFLFNTGLTSKEWNKKMLLDSHLKVVRYEADSTKIFPSIDIKGGVAIMLRDTTTVFEAIREFIPDDTLRKVATHFENNPDKNLSRIVYSGRSDLKFTNKFINDYPQSIDDRLAIIQRTHTDVKKLSPNEEYELKSSTFEVLPYVFLNEEPLDTTEYFKLLGLISLKRCYRWISKKYMIPRYIDNNNIYKYKILLPESNGSGKFGEVLSSPIVVGPNVSSTPTFISIGKFNSIEEAENALKYIKTKLVRALLGILKKTQHNPSSVWAYIPIQDFSCNSDIDWSKTISEIDKQLYAKYQLDNIEISFIEEKIKPME